jgi:hypothetical protein
MSDLRGPERLGDILARILRQRGLSDRGKLVEIQRRIDAILGPGRAEGTRVRALQRGVLTLGIRSAPLRHEIENFYGRDLLAGLQGTPAGGGVRKIRYILEG